MKALFIAEKASVKKAVEEVYRKNRHKFMDEITFVAQAGHLVTLKTPEEIEPAQEKWDWDNIPFFPEENGGWQYKLIPGREKLFFQIKKEIHSGEYDYIIHAGDSDQEGQLLCNLVLQMCKNTLPVKRYWESDLTEENIIHSLSNLMDNDHDAFLINLQEAALGRQHSDYLVGMNVTEAATLKMGTFVSVGRVKSPLLKIVADRELAIRSFKPKTNYELGVEYKEGFSAAYFKEGEEVTPRFETKEECRAFSSVLSDEAEVLFYHKERQKIYASPLFHLASLQIAADKAFGYDVDETLKTVQSLYEKKLMSYPRTSCPFISTFTNLEALLKSCMVFKDLEKFVKEINKTRINEIRSNKKYVNDAKLKESGHGALTPTTKPADLSSLTEKEKNILWIVCRQYVAVFLDPLEQDKVSVITKNCGYLFRSSGKVLVKPGYTELIKTEKKDTVIPELHKGDLVHVKEFRPVEKTTVCPKRFTEGDLVEIMENPAKYLEDSSLKKAIKSSKGIGTPATRAQIIKQMIERDHYMEKKKGKGKSTMIFATDKAIAVIRNIGSAPFCQIDMTGIWEDKLEMVRTGKIERRVFEQEIRELVVSTVDEIRSSKMETIKSGFSSEPVGVCPKCGKDVIMGKKYYLCKNYKAETDPCDFIFPCRFCEASISKGEMKKILAGSKTKEMEFTNKEGKKFSASLVYKEGKITFQFPEKKSVRIGVCPKCGKDVLSSEKYYRCSEYKKTCDFIMPVLFCGNKIPEKEMIKILSGKESSAMDFISKAGKKFKAKLFCNHGKIEFHF